MKIDYFGNCCFMQLLLLLAIQKGLGLLIYYNSLCFQILLYVLVLFVLISTGNCKPVAFDEYHQYAPSHEYVSKKKNYFKQPAKKNDKTNFSFIITLIIVNLKLSCRQYKWLMVSLKSIALTIIINLTKRSRKLSLVLMI